MLQNIKINQVLMISLESLNPSLANKFQKTLKTSPALSQLYLQIKFNLIPEEAIDKEKQGELLTQLSIFYKKTDILKIVNHYNKLETHKPHQQRKKPEILIIYKNTQYNNRFNNSIKRLKPILNCDDEEKLLRFSLLGLALVKKLLKKNNTD
jgi:hypothetical protein